MSRSEIVEHAGYVGDGIKLDAYRRALAEMVKPGSSVLDLGTGTGILGLLAAEAGARIVYSVDSGGILGAARAVAVANGYADRVHFLRGLSTRVVLPELVDVIVCDQIGGLVYDAGVLEYFRDARSRLLAPGGVLMPASFRLFLAPITTQSWAPTVGVWDTKPAGFDFGPVAELATNTEYRVGLEESAFLAEPAQLAELESYRDDPIRGGMEFRIQREGDFHGLAGMFVAQLSPSVTLTNCPLWAGHFDRWQNFYPAREAIPVSPGDVVTVEMDIRPRTYIATWNITVRSGSSGDELVKQRSSTVLGTMLAPEDLAIQRGAAVPSLSPAAAADRYALELIDGSRTVGEITKLVLDVHGDVFSSDEDAKRRVTGLLSRHLHGPTTCAS